MSAGQFNTTNMIAFVDRNRLEMDGPTEDEMKLEPFADKWTAFGFDVKEIDGHNFKELCDAIDYALAATEKPVMIICNTIKGCGIDFMENDFNGITARLIRICTIRPPRAWMPIIRSA